VEATVSPLDPKNMQVQDRTEPRPNDPERMRANARSVLAAGVGGGTAYVLEFAGDDDSTAFGQVGLDDEPGWRTGLALAPDGVDLTMDEADPDWRCDVAHLKFYAELAAIAELWHAENESFDGGPFTGRQEREQELRDLYQRWQHLPGLRAVNAEGRGVVS
jgi:hypothetical protein